VSLAKRRRIKPNICHFNNAYWAETFIDFFFFFFPLALEPKSGLGRLTVDVSRSHTVRHTRPVGLLPLQMSLPTKHRTSTGNEHPYPQRDSNSPAHQSSGPIPTPYTTWPPGSETFRLRETNVTCKICITEIFYNLWLVVQKQQNDRTGFSKQV
jgi:hypothetical protein